VGPRESSKELGKHRIAFEEAASVLQNPKSMTTYDPDHSESEERWVTLGISNLGRLIVVCHTFHEQYHDSAAVRIYSARKATRREIRAYERT
jgi:hypothetical protein